MCLKRFRRHRRIPRRGFDHSVGNDRVNPRDLVNTPDELAKNIVGHFRAQISGRVLEPCGGGGAFTRAFAYHGIKNILALEITRGSDFFEFHERVDWIITNPPWSLAKQFLQHAYRVAENVLFLITLHHIFDLRSRIADMERAGFGIKEVLLCETPDKPWPQSGFQLGAVHLQRGYRGAITWGWLDDPQDHKSAASIRPTIHILRASALAIPLANESVQTVVTSPSYYLLRRYAGGTDADFGREKSIGEYIDHIVMAMREVWRVLRNDGIVFLNVGDSYHGSGRGAGKRSIAPHDKHPSCDGTPLRGQGRAKSLCLIPQRAMIALENDGWIIRNDIIWAKPNCVPESIKDRCTTSYEHVIVLVKSRKYYWNEAEAVEPSVCWEKGSLGGGTTPSKKDGKMREFTMRHSNKVGSSKTEKRMSPPIGNVKHQALGNPTLVGNRVLLKPTRNLRDLWSINTRPHKQTHIAMFPEALVERCIRIGSRPGDTVMDCFAGSGTTGVVARQLGRNAVLMDISEEYVNSMKQRLQGTPQPTAEAPTSEELGSGSAQTPFYRQDRTEEWYTPTEVTEAARRVMGAIDCDPATSDGNHTAAKNFFTAKTNGLCKEWLGNVWLNPPFGRGLAAWMYKLNEELASGRVSQAICLVPVWTNAHWFHALCERGASLCFPQGINFVDSRTMEQRKRPTPSPIVIVYVGNRHEEFQQEFKQFGLLTHPLPNLVPCAR